MIGINRLGPTFSSFHSDSNLKLFMTERVLVFAECFCEGGEDKRIPLLRDVFDAFPNTPVNIDIKVNNDTLIRKVCVCVILLKLNSYILYSLFVIFQAFFFLMLIMAYSP